MRRTFILLCSFLSIAAYAQIDMQAHVASDEGKAAYQNYASKQQSYYSGNYAYQNLAEQEGSTLFGTLNELMGSTCKTNQNGFDYGALRYAYVSVDKDLNKSGNFIAFYSGSSAPATWDSGKTWNREHVWPQSNGVSSSKPMGYDMNSVRPSLTKDNSTRGNTAYGESSGYYNPDELSISNTNYKAINNGTYKGDCARIILYDYLVYGSMGGKKNVLYNNSAQLLEKLGGNDKSVFESVAILLKWHMQDPPSLTEIVRNDGGEVYQGNRNPFIDYPEFAIQILQDEVKTYKVSTNMQMQPAYRMTTADGFVAYLNKSDGSHPQTVEVSGATYNYNAQLGRITLSQVSNDVTITTSEEVTSLDDAGEILHYYITGNRLCVDNLSNANVAIYTLSGTMVSSASAVSGEYNVVLPAGAYILRAGASAKKILIVDDEKLIVKGLKFSLEQDGYEVECTYDGVSAVEMAGTGNYDLILLDVMLPELTGYEVCQHIREFSDVPIIMLTAKSEDIDKILGLEYGADDYITKPFIITVRDMQLNVNNRSVTVGGREVNLTAKEFDLLEFLTKNPERIYSREELLKAVWESDSPGDLRTVDVHVRRLREKIEKNPGNPEYVHTKWGLGYYFKH